MTRTDDNHRVAQIIKGLEKRIADLEEKDRSTGTPNLLRSHTDRVVADDSTITVTEIPLNTGRWNDGSGDTTTVGYGEGGYGEGEYGGYSTSSGSGGTGSIFTQTANSGWNTSTWGAYALTISALLVYEGESYTIATGETESYTSATIDGTLTVDGILETTE